MSPFQSLELVLRHPGENRTQIRELAQTLIDGGILDELISEKLESFNSRYEELTQLVCSFLTNQMIHQNWFRFICALLHSCVCVVGCCTSDVSGAAVGDSERERDGFTHTTDVPDAAGPNAHLVPHRPHRRLPAASGSSGMSSSFTKHATNHTLLTPRHTHDFQ